MLSIPFTRDSAPISDADLLAVIDGARVHLQSSNQAVHDQALLLSKMAFRIDQLRAAAGRHPSDCEIGVALKPFERASAGDTE